MRRLYNVKYADVKGRGWGRVEGGIWGWKNMKRRVWEEGGGGGWKEGMGFVCLFVFEEVFCSLLFFLLCFEIKI